MRRNAAGVGDLTEQITLESKSTASDGMGGHVPTWSAYATDIWAKVEPMRGSERLASARPEGLSLYAVTIRSGPDLQEKHRMKWGTRYLNVRFVRARGPRDLYLVFEAELGAATA